MRRVLDAVTDAPAWIRDFRYDKLAFNQLGAALYAPLLAAQRRPPNSARFVFLDPAAREFYVEWERIADDIAAVLRSEAGRHPDDRQLMELIGELCTQSEEFAVRWAAHNVRFHRAGQKVLNHPVVGRLDLTFEAMEFPARPGLTMVVYTAPAGTPTADSLKLLASWAAESQTAAESASP
jgi:hypothetical protein